MNTGIELLLKRIQDCPDDFQYDASTDHSTKWNKLLMEALRSDVITDEEKVALRAEITKMGRERFTEKVMKVLTGEGEESEAEKLSQMAHSITLGAGAIRAQPMLAGNTNPVWSTTATGTLNANSLTLGNTTISEATLKQLLDARTLASKPGGFIKKHWWNKTLPELFGKK